MIKAVFFDIDGTLLSRKNHQVPASTMQALSVLKKNGIKVFLSTGRSPLAVDILLETINREIEFDGIVAFTGQHCTVGEKVIYKRCFPREMTAQFVEYFKQNDMACCFELENRSWFNALNHNVQALFSEIGRRDRMPKETEDIHQALHQDVYQLTVFNDYDEDFDLEKTISGVQILRWNPMFMNVILADGGKAVGIQKMQDYFGFAQSETMAFGDSENDIDMLRHVQIGIAMGNASDFVKSKAPVVTDSVDDNGIYNALKKYGLI